MGIFGKFGANKNDVKIAKIKLEQTKIEEKKLKKMSKEEKEELKKKQLQEQVDGYCNYTKLNFEKICLLLNDLKRETISQIDNLSSMEKSKLSFKEKGEIKKLKEKIVENIQYLYLAKDYLVFLTKNSSGITLKEEQTILVIKFAPYFDGSPVLQLVNNEDEDDSLFGMFKEVGMELKDMFVSSKSSSTAFDFFAYLEENYGENIELYKLPNIEDAIDNFRNVIGNDTFENKESVLNSSVVENKEIKCSNCGKKLSVNSKFCPECGNKIETTKTGFCTQCGEPVAQNSKFCANCGAKIN